MQTRAHAMSATMHNKSDVDDGGVRRASDSLAASRFAAGWQTLKMPCELVESFFDYGRYAIM